MDVIAGATLSQDPPAAMVPDPAGQPGHQEANRDRGSCGPLKDLEATKSEPGGQIQVNGTGGELGEEAHRAMGVSKVGAGVVTITQEPRDENHPAQEPRDESHPAQELQDESHPAQEPRDESHPAQEAPEPNDVTCDSCIDSPRCAVKSCLTCQVSYCEEHLRPHLENARFQSHRLVQPLSDTEVRTCDSHTWPLVLYCHDDGLCVCQECARAGHSEHRTVGIGEARTLIEKELKEKEAEMQKAMMATESAIQKLQGNTVSIEGSIAEVRDVIRQQFGELQAVVEKAQKEVMEMLEGEAKQAFKQAGGIRTHLEQRCADLKKTQVRVEKLSKTKNDVDYIQEYSQWKQESLDLSLPGVYINLVDRMAHFSRLIVQTTKELSEQLPSSYRDKLKETSKSGTDKLGLKTMVRAVAALACSHPKTREDFLKYHTPLSFDPNTVHKFLRLTEENRKVMNTSPWQHSYPDTPERFEHWRQVLSAESFYQSRHYFEAELKGEGAYVGVTYKSIERKGDGGSGCISGNDSSWCLQSCSLGFSAWHGDAETPHKTERFARVGVFVDYVRGCLVFYGVADTMVLLHEYQAEFLEPLHAAVLLPKKESAVVLVAAGNNLPKTSPPPSSAPPADPAVTSEPSAAPSSVQSSAA